MQQGICSISLIPMRAEPSSKSEMVSQLLFGESYEVLVFEDEWVKIRNHRDQYQGWINHLQHESLIEPMEKQMAQTHFPWIECTEIASRESVFIPFGATLPISIEQGKEVIKINAKRYLVQPETTALTPLMLPQALEAAKRFLNAPYLWGGKSVLGIDCSGFTQVVFNTLGKQLPRDAWQQALEGETLTFVEEVKPGDLLFFGDMPEKITHVGIGLGEGKIIHAAGKVRIDTIDSYGIYNANLKKHTHVLRNIKRII